MASLIKALGRTDAERFITTIIRESGDYTQSRRIMFDDLTVDVVFRGASEHMAEHPLDEETRMRLQRYQENQVNCFSVFLHR